MVGNLEAGRLLRVVCAASVILWSGCGGGPARDRLRTAAELSRERPAPLSHALSATERESHVVELGALNARIDDALASDDEIGVLDLLGLTIALEVSDPACPAACERRLLFLYDGLALMHAGHFRFSATTQSEDAALYDGMLARAPALARWAMGRVLSVTDDPSTVSLVLQRLAGRERDDAGDLEQARRHLEWALALAPSAEAHAALGAVCYRLGDLSCGDEALRALDGSPEAEALGRLRDAARTAALPERTLEAQLARAEALVTLQRQDEAMRLYAELIEQHPDDARPLVGRAQTIFLDPANVTDPTRWVRAAPDLDRAGSLSHREGRYYELATVMWGSSALRGSEPAELATRLSAIVSGFGEIDPATASAVDVYGRTMLGFLGARGVERPTPSEVATLRARHPDSPHLYRLWLWVALSGEEHPTADTFTPFPGADDSLELVRLAAALRWNDPSLVNDAALMGEARAVALALRARQGLASWSDVAARYLELVEQADGARRHRLGNGLAVATWWTGDREGARALFAQLDEPAARLNLLATSEANARNDAWTQELRGLLAIDNPGIACGAARVLEGAQEISQAERSRTCAPGTAAVPELQGTVSSGTSVEFTFVISSRTGFTSSFDVIVEPWLLVAP